MARWSAWGALSLLTLSGCAQAGPEAAAAACAADAAHWVRAERGCLAIQGFGPSKAAVLVVVVHGDVSSGGPARYHVPVARRIAETLPGVAAVALVRPGYPDGEGRVSDGEAYGRFDHYTPANVAMVAQAIDGLRMRAGARRVVAVGHSGGAATIADILALHVGTIDAAVLLACPCDLASRQAQRRAWPRSVDPIAVADLVPTTAQVAAYTGDVDSVTSPALARAYVDRLARRGVQARFTLVPQATHNGLVAAIWETDFPSALAGFAGR